MIEVVGDLWTFPGVDVRCITTNGTLKADGTAVMGRGCAYEAKTRYPGIERQLGVSLQKYGNSVQPLWTVPGDGPWDPWDVILSFPVKHNWWEAADLDLIENSASKLMILIDDYGYDTVLLPRPGCGNGRLKWEDVKKVIAPILDDRVLVISKEA